MRKFYKWGSLFCFIFIFNTISRAQLNYADSSLFNSIFTGPLYISYWNLPYKWYVDDSVKSVQALENRFYSSFPFTPADMNSDTYKNISYSNLSYVTDVNASFNQFPFIYGQTNPVMKMPFTLNGKNDTAFTSYTPSAAGGNCKTAFFFIHGNGVNTTSYLLQGLGYACAYCNVKNTCLQYGDVYIYSKPNEDWRAIYWNRKKLNDYVYNYCEAIGHNYGTNYLIETIALVKSLQSKYERVIVLGLSEGGYTTLLNFLNTEPDGAVVSAGYSINFDTYTPSQFILSNRFGNVPQQYKRDSVKAKINRLQTNTLFTYGEADVVELMDPEHDNHYTENYLNNYAKCSFYYNFNTHTFPQCNTLDTFIQRIITKPKAFLIPADSVCISDSLQIKVRICGQAPFQYDLYRDDVLFSSVSTNNDTSSLTLFSEGKYQVKNITDATNNQCWNSNIYNYKKDSAIGFSITGKHFNCDSNLTEIALQLSGSSPWYLSSTIDSTALTDTFYNNAVIRKYNNAELNYIQLTDSNHCSLPVNQLISIKDSLTDITLSNPVFACDSGKTKITIALQGRSPWLLQYKKNGVPANLLISTAAYDLYFDNGLYELLSVSDSNQCQKLINEVHNFNFDTLDVALSTPVYSCDSNKTWVHFDLQGNPPFEIHYTKDSTAQTIVTGNLTFTEYFENGNYVFSNVSDATGCVQNIGQSFHFNTSAVDYALSVPQYVCDSSKTMIHFDLQGNAPWTIQYTQNGVPLQVVSNTDSIDLFFSNGFYQFMQVTDATNCSKNINQGFAFNYDTLAVQLGAPLYNCDSNKTQIQFDLQGNPPYDIHYIKDGTALSLTTGNAIVTRYFDNGNYSFLDVTDATGCIKSIGQNFNFNYNPINYALSLPQYICDSNKTLIHFDLQGNAPWTIQYTHDGNPLQMLTNAGSFDQYFANGLYQFLGLTDATNCSININQGFAFNYDTIAVQLSLPAYSCDSNKTMIHFDLQGNPPFEVHYTKNGSTFSINTNNAGITSYFDNGTYVFLDVTDATGCVKNIGQAFTFSYDALNYTMSIPQYHCDSNKTLIHFDLQGNTPWTIDYTENGIPKQVVSNVSSADLFVSNGNYQFMQVSDVTNCTVNINQGFTFNYAPVNAAISQQKYDCDSNKYRIDLLLDGNGPWTVEYNNGIQFYSVPSASQAVSLQLQNGSWVISKITDATGCEFNLNYAVNVNYQPLSVAATVPVYDCDSNKSRVNFSLTGNPPWKIHYTDQNLLLSDSVLTYNPNYTLYLSNGLYLVTHVSDSTQCTADVMQSVNNFYTPLTYQQNPQVYNCDSSKMLINYSFTGDAPYTLSYINNVTGIITQLSSLLPAVSFYLADGDYTILSVQDLKCSKTINDTIHLFYPKLTSSILPASVSCDSNKVYVWFATPQGNPPYTYYFYYNNQYDSITSHNNLSTLYLNNGNYFFEKVTDSMGCSVMYNQTVNAFYLPYQYNGFSKKYNCEKDSTELTFDVSVFTKTFIAYKFNGGAIDSFVITPNAGSTFTISNGNYEILNISDSAGCLQNINELITVDEEPVTATFASTLNCEFRKYNYQFNLQGKSPWTLSYNYLNLPRTEVIQNSPYSWFVDAGFYYFDNITDSNGCVLHVQRTDTLQAFLNDYPTLYYKDFTLHTINTPHKYYWFKDEIIIDSISKGTIPSFGNGIYKVLIVDELGCTNWSNELTLEYPVDINVFPNPATTVTNIVVNNDFGKNWNYQLYDMSGRLLQERTIVTPSAQIDMRHHEAGVYSVIIRFANQAGGQKHVIRLVKD